MCCGVFQFRDLFLAGRINAAELSTIERPHLRYPRLEANEGFITAQQVRDIRASLRALSSVDESTKSSVVENSGQQHQRVDTEHRGVTGTLVLTDVLDDKVESLCPFFPGNLLVLRGISVLRGCFPVNEIN